VVSVSFDSRRKTTTVTANGGRNDGGDVLLGNSWTQVKSRWKQCQVNNYTPKMAVLSHQFG
jgi:hypothetical protein